MNASRIRGWLLQLPKPTMIRVTVGDGEPVLLKPGRSFVRTAESVVALSGELVECLDGSGVVLRALRLDSPDARRSDAPEIPEAAKGDPHVAMFMLYANLLHRAYEHSTEVAFTKMVELAEGQRAHTESIEARLERTESALRKNLAEQVEDAFERADELAARAAEGEGDGAAGGLQSMIAQTFLSGALSAKPPTAPPTKTNGKSNGKA